MHLKRPSVWSLPILSLFAALVFTAGSADAQIAPECEGVSPPSPYSEAAQQSFLQNYFAAGFLQTPLGGPIPLDAGEASIAFEVKWLPSLGCQERFVLNGTKTEDTNLLPVAPKPRIRVGLPQIGPLHAFMGFSFLPPVGIPGVGSLLQAGGEFGLGYRAPFGLDVGLRAHMNMARAKAEIATPFVKGDPAYDDVLFASGLGADLGVAYTMDLGDGSVLHPYINAGVADISTLFLVGDNLHVVQNVNLEKDGVASGPWWGATAAAGVQVVFWNHLDLTVEASTAYPVFSTVTGKIGYQW